jgi:hypothetical protein
VARQLHGSGWRRRRDAPFAARLRPRRGRRPPLGDDHGQPGLLPGHQARPQSPPRLNGRRWPARSRGSARCTRAQLEDAASSPNWSAEATSSIHDPTAGLVPHVLSADVRSSGAVASGRTGRVARAGWDFCAATSRGRRHVFAERFIWDGLDRAKVCSCRPRSTCSRRRTRISRRGGRPSSAVTGIAPGDHFDRALYQRHGRQPVTRRSSRRARSGRPRFPRAPSVSQVSRWDRLKDLSAS